MRDCTDNIEPRRLDLSAPGAQPGASAIQGPIHNPFVGLECRESAYHCRKNDLVSYDAGHYLDSQGGLDVSRHAGSTACQANLHTRGATWFLPT